MCNSSKNLLNLVTQGVVSRFSKLEDHYNITRHEKRPFLSDVPEGSVHFPHISLQHSSALWSFLIHLIPTAQRMIHLKISQRFMRY